MPDPAYDFPSAMRCRQEDVDVLCSHCPGYMVLDRCVKGARAGSRYLQSALPTSRPKAHLLGHVHEEYGYQESGSLRILSVNSSMTATPVRYGNRGHIITFEIGSKDGGNITRLLGIEER